MGSAANAVRDLRRKAFQDAVAETLNRQAAAIQQLHELLTKQGEFLADLSVTDDRLRQAIADTAAESKLALAEAKAACAHAISNAKALEKLALTVPPSHSLFVRLKWLVTGK